MKKQFTFTGNTLELCVKRGPLVARAFMLLVAVISVALPLMGIIMRASSGKGMHIGLVIGLFVFGLMGFYLLRFFLWNTYGKETLTFTDERITYVADYGWFKDGRKEVAMSELVGFAIRRIGYKEDNKGALVIVAENSIFCAAKLSNPELEEVLAKLADFGTILGFYGEEGSFESIHE